MKPIAPKACIFCNGTPLSREHVWANWIRHHVERSFANSQHFVQTRTRETGEQGARVENAHGKLHNPGDPASHKLSVVCRTCNNGWMSELQEKARPILVPMLTGKPWSLEYDAQRTLAAWATMFAIVYESGVPQASAMFDEDLKTFATTQTPLTNWRIFVGTYSGTLWRTRIESYSCSFNRGYGSPFQPPTAARVNTAATTAAIGSFLLHTFYSHGLPLGLIDENFSKTFRLQQIWPVSNTIRESCPAIDDTLASRIARCFREVD